MTYNHFPKSLLLVPSTLVAGAIVVVAEVTKLIGIAIGSVVTVTMVAPAVEVAVQVALLGIVVVRIVPSAVTVTGPFEAVGVEKLRVAAAYSS